MLDANYIRHFSVLGKLCKLYDDASTTEPLEEQTLSAFLDQVANDNINAISITLSMGNYAQSIFQSIISGTGGIASLALSAASAYLADPYFTGNLTTVPAGTSAIDSLNALITEMGSGVDNKTLTTLSGAGLVHFFNTILGTTGSWHTSGSPDYPDATYVTNTVI